MSKTLLNRLAMFEVLDVFGALTVTELSRRCGIDVTVVSRTVAACEPQGWLVRAAGKVALGPRCTLLGYRGPIAGVINQAENLVHAVAGVTGLMTQAFGLVGPDAVLIALAEGSHQPLVEAQANLSIKMPIQSLAAGWAIAVQLDDQTLDHILPPEPYADAESVFAEITAGPAGTHVPPTRPAHSENGNRLRSPQTRQELDAVLAAVRETDFSLDLGSAHPGIHCIAVPWRQPALPASLGCLGPPEVITANATLIRRTLTVAAQPGATPRDVVLAAAQVMTEEAG